MVLKAKKALADSGALIKEFSAADQVLERRKSIVRFTTGSKNLDDAIVERYTLLHSSYFPVQQALISLYAITS